MSNPRVEEVSSSESDPSDIDIDALPPTVDLAPVSSLRTRAPPSPQSHKSGISSSSARAFNPQAPPADYKSYRCLYPLYFDASRTRQQGRRVSKEQAVKNPLAREIVDAVQVLGLKTVFEPGKCHPKDWANPGRVKVGLKEGGGVRVKNKHHLYNLVSSYLQSHPTKPETPLSLRIQGMPMPDGPLPPPVVPKGYKINEILPLHSPALSGGGISENILGDMMREMQGAGNGQPAIPGMGNADVEGLGGGGAGGQGKRRREGGKKK